MKFFFAILTLLAVLFVTGPVCFCFAETPPERASCCQQSTLPEVPHSCPHCGGAFEKIVVEIVVLAIPRALEIDLIPTGTSFVDLVSTIPRGESSHRNAVAPPPRSVAETRTQLGVFLI